MQAARQPNSGVICVRFRGSDLAIIEEGRRVMGQTISQFTRSATTALGRAVLEAATEANIGPGKGDWSNSSMREHPLNPEQKAAVARLESSGMYCSDQEMLLAVADESMNSADRRLVERVLKAAHHRPVRDMRPPVPPDLLERITKAAAAVEARRWRLRLS